MESHFLSVVVAFIRPARIERVTRDLSLVPGFAGLSYMDVQGLGSNDVRAEGDKQASASLERYLRLEVFCRGSDTTPIIHTIQRAAHTGRPGDGKLFILDVAWAVRLRTNAIGDSALFGASGLAEE